MSALELTMPAMQTYCYQPLDDGPLQTRLLVIQPARSGDAPLRCRVVNHELEDPYQQADSYDALSYAWGSSELVQRMWIDDDIVLPITHNLYEALIHIRHRSLERVLWADAVCIDQSNDREKERQIIIMRRIYAHAQCVIVWLGPEADHSPVALNTIRDASFEDAFNLNARSDSLEPLRALFSRSWFSRIWILQEVEAAQHIRVLCGRNELDKKTFNLGLRSLFARKQEEHQNFPLQPFQSVIGGLTLVMRSSGYMSSPFGKKRPSIGQLLDIFRHRESSRIHDQVYALLGMSQDLDKCTGIRPDYRKSWFEVQKEVVRYIIGPQLRAGFTSLPDFLAIQTSGHMVGRFSEVKGASPSDEYQEVEIKWSRDHYANSPEAWRQADSCRLSGGAEVNKGDVICQIAGTQHMVITRPRCTHLEIIRIHPVITGSFDPSLVPVKVAPRKVRLGWYVGHLGSMEGCKATVQQEPASIDLSRILPATLLEYEQDHPILDELQDLVEHMLLLRDCSSQSAWECLDQDLHRILEIVESGHTQNTDHGKATLQRTLSILDDSFRRRHLQISTRKVEGPLMPASSHQYDADQSNLASNILRTLKAAIEELVCRDAECKPREWNLFHWAVLADNEAILHRTLQKQQELSSERYPNVIERMEAFAEAAFHGSFKAVETLFESTDPGAGRLQMALNLACFSNDIEMVKMLLQKGAKVDVSGGHQTTSEYFEYHRQVIPGGANLRQLDEYGHHRPLRYAVEGNHVTMAKFLLEHGARSQTRNHGLRDRYRTNESVHSRDPLGDTPRLAALRIGNPEMISLLERYATREAEADRDMAAAYVTNRITS